MEHLARSRRCRLWWTGALWRLLGRERPSPLGNADMLTPGEQLFQRHPQRGRFSPRPPPFQRPWLCEISAALPGDRGREVKLGRSATLILGTSFERSMIWLQFSFVIVSISMQASYWNYNWSLKKSPIPTTLVPGARKKRFRSILCTPRSTRFAYLKLQWGGWLGWRFHWLDATMKKKKKTLELG